MANLKEILLQACNNSQGVVGKNVRKARVFADKKIARQIMTLKFIRHEVKKEIRRFKWPIITWIICYFLCWGLLLLFEPSGSQIRIWYNYLYYIVVTMLTLGYGDVVPVSPGGRLSAIFFIVFFIVSFAAYGAILYNHIRKIYLRVLYGDIIVNAKDHVLIVEYQDDCNRTDIVVDELLTDTRREQRQILVCFDKKNHLENPLKGKASWMGFDRGFKNEEFIKKACVSTAHSILIDTGNDDLNVSLFVMMHDVNPDAHFVIAFNNLNENKNIIGRISKSAKCVTVGLPALIARCLQDPYSAEVAVDTVDASGETLYDMIVPDDFDGCSYRELRDYFADFSRQSNVKAICDQNANCINNPPLIFRIEPGMVVCYARSKRFKQGMIKWDEIVPKQEKEKT